MLKKVLIESGQTAWDIAIQYYGNIEGYGFLIEDNPTLDLQNLIAGTYINLRASILNSIVVEYFANKKIISR